MNAPAQADAGARVTSARMRLIMNGATAFWGTLAMGLRLIERNDIPTMATDGAAIYWNRRFAEAQSDRVLECLAAHEVGHCVLGHHARRGTRDLKRWNEACDYALNPLLVASGFKLWDGALLDMRFSGMSAEEIFATLEREQEAEPEAEPESCADGGADDSDKSGAASPQEPGADDGGNAGQDASGGADGADDSDGADADDSDGGDNAGDGADDASGNAGADGADASGGAADGQGASQSAGASAGAGGADGGAQEPGAAQGNASGSAGAAERHIPDYGGSAGGIIDAAPAHDESALDSARRDWQAKVRQALNVARARNAGTTPGNLIAFAEAINASAVDWRAALRRFVDESTSKDAAWHRPARRFAWSGRIFPGMVADRPSHVVAIVDTSGSLWDKAAQEAFRSALADMLDCGAADKVTLAYADTDVHAHAEYMPGDTVDLEPEGGGGTAFDKPLAWVAEHCPDASAIVYMTDCQVYNWGDEPDCGILWLVQSPHENMAYAERAPFGEAIPMQAD